jgi:hypothetical protein
MLDQYIEPAKSDVDKPALFSNLITVPNIGSFAFDFTGSVRAALSNCWINCTLLTPTNTDLGPFQYQHSRPISLAVPVTRQICQARLLV